MTNWQVHIVTSCSYLPGPGNMLVLELAYKIYFKFEDFLSALRIALFIDNMEVCTSFWLEQLLPDFICNKYIIPL